MSVTNFIDQFCQDAPLVDDEVPLEARRSFFYLMLDLRRRDYLPESMVSIELQRSAGGVEVPNNEYSSSDDDMAYVLEHMDWRRFYIFCERLYTKYLLPQTNVDPESEEYQSRCERARAYYESELNQILLENRLAYAFADGGFQRPGRAITQQLQQTTGRVLSQPRFERVRVHIVKARNAFSRRPDPDPQNCVKDVMCALEAAVEAVTGEVVGQDFAKAVRRMEGNGPDQVPATLGESLIKLHAYRGAGEAVAHSASQGNKVTIAEAELALNLAASFVTYLSDLRPADYDVPF